MSLFRKRSRSQCSFVRGDDEISVSKNGPRDIDRESRSTTIRSERSSCSDISLSDITTRGSCVARNYPKHKSSQLGFLAWVAYTRKYTDEWITDIERRTCPLVSAVYDETAVSCSSAIPGLRLFIPYWEALIP